VAVDLDDRVIDVDEHQIIDRGQHRVVSASPDSTRAATASSWRT